MLNTCIIPGVVRFHGDSFPIEEKEEVAMVIESQFEIGKWYNDGCGVPHLVIFIPNRNKIITYCDEYSQVRTFEGNGQFTKKVKCLFDLNPVPVNPPADWEPIEIQKPITATREGGKPQDL